MSKRVTASDAASFYRLSPIPIVEASCAEWQRFCQRRGIPYTSSANSGMYYYNMPNTLGLPSHLIVINARLANYKKIAVLFHELGHHHCYQSGCKCFEEPHLAGGLSELHATISCLEQCIQKQKKTSLAYAMRCVWSAMSGKSAMHQRGAEMTMEHAIWKRSMDYVGDGFKLLPNIHKSHNQRGFEHFYA